ncbi:MAG: hypothetical protein KDH96_02120 [Candidatus Riesia sp.]|nr:hypothetical protein [Candidatus Riesia sp.]
MRQQFYHEDGMEVTDYVINREAKRVLTSGEEDERQLMQNAMKEVRPSTREQETRDASIIVVNYLLTMSAYKLIQNN